MTVAEAYQQIAADLPPAIYVGGKTCTGKSMFSRRLQAECSYFLIDLDQIVLKEVVPCVKDRNEGSAFIEVYRNRDKHQWIDKFVSAVHKEVVVATKRKQRVVIEGAVAHPETLKELLQPMNEVLFIYFHPENLSNYERNLTSRFQTSSQEHKAGLPSRFWEGIDPGAFAQFCRDGLITSTLKQNIRDYAVFATVESKERLENLKANFSKITVLKV